MTMRVRRTALIKRSGPYEVSSRVDGVIMIKPRWQQSEEEGGGPGLLSRIALAENIERWLNATYANADGLRL